MEKFKIGDRIRILHEGENYEGTVMDILIDYDSDSYWVRDDQGRLMLEIETPETKIEKVNMPETVKECTSQILAQA